MTKIRVAFFADMLEKDTDGAVRTMYQLIDRIPHEKFDFMFFCGKPPQDSFNFNVVTVPTLTLPFNKTYKIALANVQTLTLTRTLQNFNPQVIHIATPSLLGFFALNYAHKNKLPVLSIYHTHYISYLGYYLKSFSGIKKISEKYVTKKYNDFYNKCNVVYTPSTQMVTELKQLGINHTKLKLWQRGLDTRLFHPTKKDENFIQQITKNTKPSILFVSRLVWEKNLETLFEIYDEIEFRKMDINFIVAGTGAAEEDVRHRMKNAIFLGKVDHQTLAKLYASCVILVFPSISETYGNVVVEAMASGCVPVIAKGGGSQSLVRNGETGFLCQPNSAITYVEKIKQLLNDTNLRAYMQQEGLKFTLTLNWEYLAREYFNDLECLARLVPAKANVIPFRRLFATKAPSSKIPATSL